MKNLFLILVIFFLLAGCSTAPHRSKTQIADARLLRVFNNAKKGLVKDNSAAVADLKKIVANYSDYDIAVPAAYSLAEHYSSKEKFSAALEYYKFIIQNSMNPANEAEAVTKSVKIYQRLNQSQEALALLNSSLESRDMTPEGRRTYLFLKYDLIKDTATPIEQLDILAGLYAVSDAPEEKTSYTLKAMNVIENRFKQEDLKTIVENNSYTFVQAPIAFKLALVAFDNSDLSGARTYLNRVLALQPQSDIAERSQDLLNQISARETVDPRAVGVILPLSGKHEAMGRRLLSSIAYAFDLYGKGSNYRLAVFDSEGKASLAQRGVEKLVTEDHVIAIIGEVLSKTATAVASKAQSLGVPTIILSQKADVTETGDFVFRNALTGKMQVQFLVKNAIEKKGLTRFAILYPNDGYGVEYANLFWDEVIAQGGQVTAAQPYSPTETDFRKPIQRLIGTFYVEDREPEYGLVLKDWFQKQPHRSSRKKIPDDLLQPIIDFDSIFIPDSAKALGQISAMLVYNDVRDVTFLGTNLWNTPTIGARVGKYMKDSLFTDSVFTEDPQFVNSPFVINFKNIFGQSPSVFDIQAYDSAVLLKSILRSGADSRRAVQQRLSTAEDIKGALGPMSVKPNREITRPIVPLTLSNDKIIRLN